MMALFRKTCHSDI